MGYDMKGAAMIQLARQGDNAAMRAAYLDYVNNFLTVAGFASYYGMGARDAEIYLAFWRDVHEAHCAAIKTAKRDQDGVTFAHNPARPWLPHEERKDNV